MWKNSNPSPRLVNTMCNSLTCVFLLLFGHQLLALPDKDVNQTEPASETASCKLPTVKLTLFSSLKVIRPDFVVWTVCGGIVIHPYGNITSPHYPAHYENMLNCKWHFQAPTLTRIILQFHKNFSTELGYDRVSVDNSNSCLPKRAMVKVIKLYVIRFTTASLRLHGWLPS